MKLIAETAWHHEGDIEFFQNLIESIINSPADVIKIHLTLDLDEYMAKDHELYEFLKKMLISEKDWRQILSFVRKKSEKELMLLLNDTKSVKVAKEYHPEYIELHSVSLNDVHLLKSVKEHFTPETKLVFGVSGNLIYDLETILEFFKDYEIIIMFGFQNYPTKYSEINFTKIKKIMSLFPNCEYGYADHTAWNEENNILVTLLGASIGMNYVEKHVTTDYGKERVDWQAAINFKMFEEIYQGINIIDECMGNGRLTFSEGEFEYAKPGIMKKIPIAKENLKKNSLFDINKIDFKRSSKTSNIRISDIHRFMDKKFIRDIHMGESINSNDLE